MLNHRTPAAASPSNGHPGSVPAADGLVSRANNNPPSTIESAKEAFDELSAFLKNHPVISNPEEAKQASAYVERTRIALQEARDERDGKTRPHLDALETIRADYDIVRDKTKTNDGGILQRAFTALKKRLSDYANAVEAARIAEANRLRLEAEERERKAREAELAEREAIDDAEQGVESDIGAAVEQAAQAFADYRSADKHAAIAERNVPLKLRSVMGGRTMSMRTVEKLVIEDAFAAIKALGLTSDIQEAILKSARAFRKEFDELPAGITATFERSL